MTAGPGLIFRNINDVLPPKAGIVLWDMAASYPEGSIGYALGQRPTLSEVNALLAPYALTSALGSYATTAALAAVDTKFGNYSTTAIVDNKISFAVAMLTLDSLADTVITAPVNGDILKHNGTRFVNVPDTGGGANLTPQTLAYSANVTPDLATAVNFKLTLTGNTTLVNPANVPPGQSGTIEIIQDATGNRTMLFGANWIFPTGADKTLSTASNSRDVLRYSALSATSVFAILHKGVGTVAGGGGPTGTPAGATWDAYITDAIAKGVAVPGKSTAVGNPKRGTFITGRTIAGFGTVPVNGSNNPAGVTFRSDGAIWVQGNDVTLTGFDFRNKVLWLDGNNTLFEQCTFDDAWQTNTVSVAQPNTGVTGLKFKNCDFLGLGRNQMAAWIWHDTGAYTVENCWFENPIADHLKISQGVITGSGFWGGGYGDPTSHFDPVQTPHLAGPITVDGCVFHCLGDREGTVGDPAGSWGFTSSTFLVPDVGATNAAPGSLIWVKNCSMRGPASYHVYVGAPFTNVKLENLRIDSSGSNGPFNFDVPANVTKINCTNLLTGAAI